MAEKLRAQIETPFSWQSKEVLRFIRMHLDQESTCSRALLIYFALTEAASDAGCSEFKVKLGRLADLSGFSKRTVENGLRDLSNIGVVQIVPQMTPYGHRDRNLYRLISKENLTSRVRIDEGNTHPAFNALRSASDVRTVPNTLLIEQKEKKELEDKQHLTEPNDEATFIEKRAAQPLIKPRGRRRLPISEPSPNETYHQGLKSNPVTSLVREIIRRERPNLDVLEAYFKSKGVGDCKNAAQRFRIHGEKCSWSHPDGRSWTDWRLPANRFAVSLRRNPAS